MNRGFWTQDTADYAIIIIGDIFALKPVKSDSIDR